jgi:hypothetical protein
MMLSRASLDIFAFIVISIDESGVHRQGGKSVIALVYVETDDIEAVEQLVLQVEKHAGIKGFHWAHRNWQMRAAFIKGIANGNFKLKVAYVANPIILDKALSEALQHLLVERNIGQILIDGDKPKSYSRQLKKVLRDKGISVKKIRSVNDESYPMIRIADAVAGAARSTYDEPNGKAAPLLKILESKIELRIDI